MAPGGLAPEAALTLNDALDWHVSATPDRTHIRILDDSGGPVDVTYAALRRYVAGEDAVRDVTIAKLATQRSAFEVMDTCLQIHGGAGYMVEYDIERAARDARLGPIGGGTDEIMKEILGRTMGL